MTDIIAMCRAASHDERLADGMLYRKAADEIERLRELLREVRARFPAGFHDAELMDRIGAALAGAADQPNGATEVKR